MAAFLDRSNIPDWFGVICGILLSVLIAFMSTVNAGEIEDANRLNQQVFKLYGQGKYSEAIPLAKKALELREKALGPAHPKTANALHNLALIYWLTGDYARAKPLFQRTLKIREKVLGPEHPKTTTSLSNLAALYDDMGDYVHAEPLFLRALKIYEKVLGPEHLKTSLILNDLGLLYYKKADYARAEPLFLRALKIRKKVLGSEHPDTADVFSNLAELYRTTGDYAKAEPLQQRALKIREKALGPEHLKTAASLNNLALLYDAMGDYARAEPLLKRALKIKEKVLGPEHLKTAASLNNLAHLYQSMGDYVRAEPLYQRALKIREKVLGPEHPGTAVSLNNLAVMYDIMGDYARAEPLYQRALKIREKVLGPEHPGTANTLNNLALLYNNMGDYTRAEHLYLRALKIYEKVLGPEHPQTARILNNLALLYDNMGDYTRAEHLYLRALKIYEKVLGPEHPDTAASLNNLATLYQSLGDYARAEPLLKRVLKIRKKVLGPEHPDTAVSLNNLAILYYHMGDYGRAEPLYQRALKIYEKVLGPEHPQTAASLDNLASLYDDMGDYARAEPLKQRALKIYEKVLGSEHPDTAMSLNNLAILYQLMGDYSRAEPLYQRALKIYEKVLGPEHPGTATALNNLAVMYDIMGDYARAEPLYQRALKIREKVLGPGHPDTAVSLNNLAFLYGHEDKAKASLSTFIRGNAVTDHAIANVFAIATEQQKLAYVKKVENGYFGALSLIYHKFPHDQAALKAGLDMVLSRKGMVFDAQARQQEAIAKSLDPGTRKLWEALSSKRAALGYLLQHKPKKMTQGAYRKRIDALQADIAQLESKLANKSMLVADQLKQRKVTSSEVAKHLPGDSVMVEFVKIRDTDWEKGKWAKTFRYLAFILRPDGKVQLVDLGDADELEKKIQAGLSRLQRISLNERDVRRQIKAAERLSRLVWGPIANKAGDAKRIIVSPDGLLNVLPFGALRDSNGKYLVEKMVISYVTSGRDLAHGDTGIRPESDLYLAANPQFDLTAVSQALPDKGYAGKVRSADLSMRFGPLPGTAVEARGIPSLVSGKKKTIVTGRNATESSVLSSRRPRVMHLATHGFFLKDQANVVSDTRGVGLKEKSLPKGYENPLIRSGLALSGANHAKEAKTDRDGLLTALEVSGMDLHGTDLVTLSACETGRGDVKAGEGVFGLRRAFALAGARHLLMSLWPVSDKVTADQMFAFYRSYGKGRSPAIALRQAQLETIRQLRKAYGTAPPSLWAPFIMQGSM